MTAAAAPVPIDRDDLTARLQRTFSSPSYRPPLLPAAAVELLQLAGWDTELVSSNRNLVLVEPFEGGPVKALATKPGTILGAPPAIG